MTNHLLILCSSASSASRICLFPLPPCRPHPAFSSIHSKNIFICYFVVSDEEILQCMPCASFLRSYICTQMKLGSDQHTPGGARDQLRARCLWHWKQRTTDGWGMNALPKSNNRKQEGCPKKPGEWAIQKGTDLTVFLENVSKAGPADWGGRVIHIKYLW